MLKVLWKILKTFRVFNINNLKKDAILPFANKKCESNNQMLKSQVGMWKWIVNQKTY